MILLGDGGGKYRNLENGKTNQKGKKVTYHFSFHSLCTYVKCKR